jgi:pyruvate dehydrogenase E2 component (dihydrolipoamide acetyltransferase)
MPSLGADMEAGTLVRWLKQPGDAVQRGDVIAEVETDKGVIDIDVFTTGVLQEILVHPGHRVPVGTRLATIRDTPEALPTKMVSTTPAPAAGAPRADAQVTPSVVTPVPHVSPVALAALPPTAGSTRVAISPAARRLAHELGVDPSLVHGTGPHGAITREDIERAVTPTPATSTSAVPKLKPVDDERAARMRNAIAAAMAKSKREIPHYYLSTMIDMQPAMNWLAEDNSRRPIAERLLCGVLLLKATALALREVPELNAFWDGKRAVPQGGVHVGIAISLRGGLIAPAIHNTDQCGLSDLMRSFRDLVKRARSGGLRSSELAEPTITVTSLGDTGVDSVLGVIYPPQVALVGFGKVVERPWSINGGLLSRQVMTATLAGDHRVSDGHRGGVFLNAIAGLLQEPEKL